MDIDEVYWTHIDHNWTMHGHMKYIGDAPPSSLMDSTTSPKLKTTKGKGVGARSWFATFQG
jgi:hypothetical protein